MRNLSRVLTGTINGASEVPDPGVRLTHGLGRPQVKRRHGRYHRHFSRRYGGTQRHQRLTRNKPVWRALPADLPPAGTVYWQMNKWQADGSTERMPDDLRERIRLADGRKAVPTAAVIDSQSVKGSEMITRPRRGYDAAKKINGTKRHLAVDNPRRRQAALWNLRRAFPSIRLA